MRTISAIIGSFTALAILTAPVLAKNSNAQPPEEKSTPSQCHSLQRAADGAWVETPCQEVGAPAQPQSKSTGRSAETSHKPD
jgi:hypothetical protein